MCTLLAKGPSLSLSHCWQLSGFPHLYQRRRAGRDWDSEHSLRRRPMFVGPAPPQWRAVSDLVLVPRMETLPLHRKSLMLESRRSQSGGVDIRHQRLLRNKVLLGGKLPFSLTVEAQLSRGAELLAVLQTHSGIGPGAHRPNTRSWANYSHLQPLSDVLGPSPARSSGALVYGVHTPCHSRRHIISGTASTGLCHAAMPSNQLPLGRPRHWNSDSIDLRDGPAPEEQKRETSWKSSVSFHEPGISYRG